MRRQKILLPTQRSEAGGQLSGQPLAQLLLPDLYLKANIGSSRKPVEELSIVSNNDEDQ